MTIGFPCEPAYARPNHFKVDCGLSDHGSHDAHGENAETLTVKARTQSVHPKITTLGHIGYHHAHPQMSCCT